MSRQRQIRRIFCIFLCINIIWSNCIFAVGFDYKLAAQTKIQDIILGAQLMYTGDKALETALENNVDSINTLYRKVARLRADFMKAQGISEEWKDKVMWLVFPDKDDLSKKSYYIFTPAGIYFRYTTSPSINDEFQLVLEKYAKSFGKPEQINGGEFYREKYEFAGENLQFIKSVLEELYGGIIESPKVFEKGEHVGMGVLEDKVKEYKKQEEKEKKEIVRDIDIYPDYGNIIIYAISEMLNKKCLEAADVSNFIYNLLRDNNDIDYVATFLSSFLKDEEREDIRKILIESTEDKDAKIIGIISESLENKNPGEVSIILYNLLKERIKVIISDNCFIYLSCYRKMRYSLLASLEGNIHITKALLDIFMSPSKFEDELKDYLGDELFNKLIGNRGDKEISDWLKMCLAGAFAHEIYEFSAWMKDPHKYEKKAVHPTANNYEKKIAGESKFDRESAFDDISKFLILKHLGMKPDINLFNIMRDRRKDSRTKRTIGPDSEYGIYELIQLDEKGMKDKLDILFYEKPHKTDKGDRYYIVTYRNRAFAISKVDKDGIETIHSLYSDGTHIDWYPIENIIQDYKDLKAKIEQPQVVEYDHSMAEDRTLAGTKCAQLAWAGKKGIPTPLGFNTTKWANLAYLRNNPHLLEALQGIKELDVMDVTARKTFSERIKKLMMEKTNLPPYLMKELQRLVTEYSRKLGYDVDKGEYASFAYRGSGLMEDFEGNIPWFKKSIGAQPGQGTTLLNAKGLDAISGAVIEAFAGLFNDQIFIYRDIQVFFEFVSKMKEEFGGGGEKEYKTLISALREAGYENISKSLEDESSPGYVRLREVLLVIESRDDLKNKYSSYNWLSKLNKAADDILNPIKLLTGVAVLEQLDVYISGTGFTSNLSNMRDGSTYARMQGKFPEGPGDDFSTYTRYERVNLGNGTGPGIVEGKFEPDKITGFSPDGNKWVIEDYEVGEKSMYMVYLDYGFNALKDVFSREKIVKIIDTYNILRKAQDGSTEKEQAIKDIKELLNIDRDDIGDWLRAMSDIWYYDGKPEFHKCPKTRKNDLLKKMKLTPRQFFILSYLIKHVLRIDTDYDKMTYLPSPNEMRERMVLKEEALQKLFQMIAQIGNLVSKEKCERGEDWHDRRDIEFAFAICVYDDPSPYKFKIEKGEGVDLLTGKPNENTIWIKLCHLQNRAINPEKEVQDPHNLVFKQKKVDYDYVEEKGIKSIAEDGLAGFSAAKGIAYVVDPHKSLTIQEQEIRELVSNKEKIEEMLQEMGYKDTEIDKIVDDEFGVIPILEEMGPEHDVIVAAAGKAIVWRGNDTSHAYIFSLEQRIPICIGAKYRAGVESIRHGQLLVIDGSGGRIWPGDKGIPLLDDDLKIRIDMLPDTRAGVIVGDLKAAEQVTRLGAQSVLTRLEFVINQKIKIYPQAALAYDNLMKIRLIRMRKMKFSDEDLIKELNITEKELEDVKILEQNPEVIKEIKKTIKGFPNACTFMAEKMRYLANAFGAIFPIGNKMRDYDNKEKEALMYGLIGAKLYLKYDDNDPRYGSPLVGMRGSALMSNSHFEKCFRELRRGILRSIKDGYSNNSFFFVFLRTPRELKKELLDLENLCKEEGVFPKEIGVMIEVPSNVWIIDDILRELKEFQKRNPGIQEIFISFGTNDLTNLTGKTPREDKDFTGELLVMDPSLLDPEKGRIEIDKGVVFGPKEKGKPWRIRINDEGAPAVLRSIEHVSSRAKKMNCIRSLCGQAITITLKRGMNKIARRIMSALDTFGTQTMNYVAAVMTDFDASHAVMETTEKEREETEQVTRLFDIREVGALSGEVVFIDSDKDVEKLRRNREKGKVTDKIVILRGKLSDIKTFEGNLIPWDYLRYARAILVQDGLKNIGEIFNQDEVIKGRVKARIRDLAEIKEGSVVTVDYNNSAVYKGKLKLAEVPVELNEITYEKGAKVDTKEILEHNGAGILFTLLHPVGLGVTGFMEKGIKVHPLAFILYADGSLDNGEFKKQIEALLEGKSQEDILRFKEEVLDGKEIDEYIEYLKRKVESELEGVTKKDIDTFLEQIFYLQMVDEYEKTGEKLCVHTTFRATRNQLKELIGGRVIEMTKGKEGVNFDDAGYRLQGGGRNISDFWRIHRAELRAFKTAKEKCPNLRLQLTTPGTRSREVLELQLKVLEDLGIDRDREEIGLRIVTPADILYVGDYIKQGIKFFTYERYELAEGLLASNFNHPLLFPGDELEKEVNFILKEPLEYIRYTISKTDKSVWLTELPTNAPLREKESHLLPLYLYMKVKEELGYNDAQMMAISYTDREGVIKIDENAASVMGTVLSRELKRNISKDKVIEVLQAHEEIEKAIMDLGIDFTGLRQGLIEYLDIVRDDWDENFKNVVGEGNGQDRLVRLLEAFLRNYPAYRLRLDELSEVTLQIVIIKEILVNQIIERMFFRQGVKVLPAGYKDAMLERIELPEGFQEILGNYLINWSKLRDRNCHYVKLSEIVSGIDPNNEELVKRLTKEVLGERLRYVNKDVNYAIAITKGDLEKRDTLIWQLQVVRDKIRDIVRITQNPVTITLELDDIDHVRDAISLLRSLGFEADNNLRFGLTIKGKGANRELINEANPIGITTLVPYEDGITEIAESSFILLLLDILYSEDLRGMDILIPYESLRAHARETQRIRGIEFVKRLFPGKEIYIKEGWVALKKLLPNQTHVARFKIDAEKVRLERGIYEPIIVIDMIDSDNFLIVDGHHRAKAAAELDRRYCPACIVTAEPPFISKDFKNIIDTNIRSGLSHLGNLGVVDVKAGILDEMGKNSPIAKRMNEVKETNIWEAGFTAGGEPINETVLNKDIYNSEIKDRLWILKKKIMEAADRFGFGILCGVDRIRLVDNIMPKGMKKEGDLVPYSMIKEENGERILLLDKDALKDEDVLYLVLLHEFREALLTIVEPKDKALRELTGIYLSAKDALKEGIKDVGDLSNLDPDSQFLKVIEQLEGKRDEEIIAVIIEFMRSISYYREFFEGPVRFDFSGDWQREMLIEIEKGIDRYQAALNVFNRIAEAKGIVTKVKVSEEKMAEEQKKKGPIERKGLKDIYKAFSELLDWYSKNTSEVFFIDTKWQGVAVRRLNGEVMSNIDLNDKYQPLWRLFKSKGINSVAISNEVFSKVKDSANRFINLIDDILFSVSETDFIGYAHINDLTVKVTPDDGGKRVVITNRLDRKAEDILDWLLTEGITKASELTNTFEKIIAESPKEKNRTMVIKADIDTLAEDNIREIRSLSKKQYADGRPMFSFYYYSSSSRDVAQYLEVKGLEQGNLVNINADDMITLIEPQRLRDIRDKKELESRYYLPMFYVKGSIYMAAHVVLLKGDIEGLRDSGALGIINVFLKELLGHHPTDEEIGMFLLNPLCLPDIESVLIKLNNLPLIIKMTTMSA